MTKKEFDEMVKLKEKLFGTDMFVVFDDDDPNAIRYNELMLKYLTMRQAAAEAEKQWRNSVALGGPISTRGGTS